MKKSEWRNPHTFPEYRDYDPEATLSDREDEGSERKLNFREDDVDPIVIITKGEEDMDVSSPEEYDTTDKSQEPRIRIKKETNGWQMK